MSKPIIYLFGFLIFIGFGAFVFGVGKACVISWSAQDNNDIGIVLSSTVTSIAAILSTNLGAVLGIGVTDPKSAYRATKVWNPFAFFTSPTPTTLQTLACYIYIVCLFSASVVWAHRGFVSDPIVPLIPELTKSLIGVIVGVLAIALNK